MSINMESYIRDIPDFPKKGIVFRDITTLLKDGKALHYMIDEMKRITDVFDYDVIIGPESRGFIVGTPLAYITGKGFIPIRKPGKLPYKTIKWEYESEYSTDSMEIHIDSVKPGENVLLVDDLLATGGTLLAACKLVEQLGGTVVGIGILIELKALGGRDTLKDYPVVSLLQY